MNYWGLSLRSATAWLALTGLVGCGGLGAMMSSGSTKPPVVAARLAPSGRGLFVVRPPPGPNGCNIPISRSPSPIECDSEYVVACDASLPESEPFCRVVPEYAVTRESIYPARVP